MQADYNLMAIKICVRVLRREPIRDGVQFGFRRVDGNARSQPADQAVGMTAPAR